MITAILIYVLAHVGGLVAPPAAINVVAAVSILESAAVKTTSNCKPDFEYRSIINE